MFVKLKVLVAYFIFYPKQEEKQLKKNKQKQNQKC